MTAITIGDRIMLHLARYDLHDPGETFNTSWDLTQDGIASSLRITRAHASVELKKLKEMGKVEETFTHIKGKRSKRKAYCLTPMGMAEVKRIKGRGEEEGIDFMPLLDMRRCDPNALLESLDDESASVLGLACVIRPSVKRDTLPETKQQIIPVDFSGYVIISEVARKRVLSAIGAGKLPELHSAAADYWLEQKEKQEERKETETERQERLYHLVKAGRTGEACRLLISDSDEFIDSMNEDLLDIVAGMEEFPKKYAADMLTVKVTMSLECMDHGSARAAAERLAAIDAEKGTLLMADVALSDGDAEGAMAILEKIPNCSDRAGWDMRMAGCLAALARYEDARKLLENTKKEMNRTGNLSCLNDVYLLLSTVLIKMGSPDDAIAQLNKAKSSAGKRDLAKIDAKLSEAYAAKAMNHL